MPDYQNRHNYNIHIIFYWIFISLYNNMLLKTDRIDFGRAYR
jgi:hypothetical protein